MKYVSEKTGNGNIGHSSVSQAMANDQASYMDYCGCVDCENCYGCFNCTKCRNCEDCSYCIGCMGGKGLASENGYRDDTLCSMEERAVEALKGYLKKPLASGYGIPEFLKLAEIIPWRYLLLTLGQLNQFKNHPSGKGEALRITIEGLIDKGYLTRISSLKMKSQYKYSGRAYKINLIEQLEGLKYSGYSTN